jgi:uncharacterized protein YecE (DUF72 family)
LPPRWKRNTERLDEFLSHCPKTMRWAVELRDPSWLHDDTYEVLARHGAALCHHDLLPDHPWVRTTDWVYERFHGPNAVARPYHGSYPRPRLEASARRLEAVLDDGGDVYAYFNNDWYGNAVKDGRWLAERLGAVAPAAASG